MRAPTAILLVCLSMLGCSSNEPATNGLELPPIQAAATNIATAESLEQAGYEADAVRQYEQARMRDPSVRVAHRLAVLYDRLGRDDRALAEYRRASEENPGSATLANDIGYFHLSRDRALQAETQFRLALERDPLLDRARVNLGLALASQGRVDDALAEMDRVLPPEESRSNVAMVLAREQRFDEARDLASQALSLRPDLAQPRALLEWLDANPAG